MSSGAMRGGFRYSKIGTVSQRRAHSVVRVQRRRRCGGLETIFTVSV